MSMISPGMIVLRERRGVFGCGLFADVRRE